MVEVKKILCGVDFGPMTSRVLDYANLLGSTLNAKIYILYVVHSLDAIEQFSVPKSYREEYETQMISQAEKKAEELKKELFNERDVEFIIKTGNPAKEVLSFIENEKIDMVLIGATNKKDVGELIFGSVGERVVKLSKVPVLVIK